MKNKKTGLFFGSFNPIHIGHLIIAGYMLEFTDLDQIWFIISPHNPLKERKTLLADYHRLALVKIAIEDNSKMKASDIEFKMPKPSYTIDTLTYLNEKYPEKDFVLIAGTDIFSSFHKWKNYKEILSNYEIYVYSRPNYEIGFYSNHPKIKIFNAPLMEISSSFIRKAIKNGKNIEYMLPEKVSKYICEMHFYEK
ncbi:MAG: nicotinate-nucleotide adenylyltransferase [Bacteroidales bacterium]|nr:nicotinate-nucleotide adenylyltransferase [Bacteroidales bacterium]